MNRLRTITTATDYGYPPDYFRPMLLSAFYVDLEDHSGGVASFYVGESGLHATTGHDNEYKQIARHDEYGTIFATPHYLKGETAYCLEHTQPSPVVRDHASGPYQIVDLDGYKVTPGHSGYIFSDKTMHALAWVLRHTYPFMVLDRSDDDNEVWCRVAGQFAMREVIKQLEGDFYVMDYWEMDEFYRAYDQAPGVYLDYARWLAEERWPMSRITETSRYRINLSACPAASTSAPRRCVQPYIIRRFTVFSKAGAILLLILPLHLDLWIEEGILHQLAVCSNLKTES